MKKKLVTILAVLCTGALVFSGCGKKDSKEKNTTSSASTQTKDKDKDGGKSSDSQEVPKDDDLPIVDEKDVTKCIEIGDYKGLKLEKTVTQVTDKDIDDAVKSNYSNTPIKDEPAKMGDTAYISYVGKIDGKEFDGGSADSVPLTLGSKSFIEGFEEGVVGMKAGDTKDLNLTFPDPYESNKDLAGKPVVFTVTVGNVTRPFTELSEEWVKQYTKSSNIDEYKDTIKKQLTDQAAATDENALKNVAWQKVLENSNVKQYQKEELESSKKEMEDYISQYAAMMGTDLDGYKKQAGISDEDYETQLIVGAKETAKSKMAMKAIAEKEKFTKKDQEYKDLLAKTAKEYGVSEDDFIKQIGQDQVDAYIESERIMKVILDSAEIKEVPAETKDTASTSSDK